jgi:hypothetical protein
MSDRLSQKDRHLNVRHKIHLSSPLRLVNLVEQGLGVYFGKCGSDLEIIVGFEGVESVDLLDMARLRPVDG